MMFELVRHVVCEGDGNGFGPLIIGLIWVVMAIVGVIKKKKSREDGSGKIDDATRRRINERLKGKETRPAHPEPRPATGKPPQQPIPAAGRNLPYAKRYQQDQEQKAQLRREQEESLAARKRELAAKRLQRDRKMKPVEMHPVSARSPQPQQRSSVPSPEPRPAIRRPQGRAVIRPKAVQRQKTAALQRAKPAEQEVKPSETVEAVGTDILTSLYEHDALQRAIIYTEILGKPVGMREF